MTSNFCELREAIYEASAYPSEETRKKVAALTAKCVEAHGDKATDETIGVARRIINMRSRQ